MRILLSLILFVPFVAYAQQYNNNWVLGYSPNHSILTFDSNNHPDTLSISSQFDFFVESTSISDSSGNLIFFTNGIKICNNLFDSIPNGDGWIKGFGYNYYNTIGLGYSQSCVFISNPGNSNQFYLFNISHDHQFTYTLPGDTTLLPNVQPTRLRYTLLDKSLNNGLGDVVPNQLGRTAINDTLFLGRIAACKHGNGRDWWVIARRYNTNLYYKILLSISGIVSIDTQSVGGYEPPSNGLQDFDVEGSAVFSPDGNKYAMVGRSNQIELFSFDRCSGLFYSSETFNFPDTSNTLTGCSFSANSGFLYVSDFNKIYQFNLSTSPVSSSGLLVANIDTSFHPDGIPILFYQHQLAPDNKIYISTWSSSIFFHTIDNPDSSGLLCQVNQHSFILAGYNLSMPNYPNYRLGRLVNSNCDTLITKTSEISESVDLRVFPNPVHQFEKLVINSDIPFASWRIYNTIDGYIANGTSVIVNTENLTAGVYYLFIEFKNKLTLTKKVIVLE